MTSCGHLSGCPTSLPATCLVRMDFCHGVKVLNLCLWLYVTLRAYCTQVRLTGPLASCHYSCLDLQTRLSQTHLLSRLTSVPETILCEIPRVAKKGAESFNLTLRLIPNRSQTHLCHAHTPANQITGSSPAKLYKPPLHVPVPLSR